MASSRGKTKYHPLIYTYLKKYQEDPNSRVFAPLAEAYRKAGLVDEAIEISREGLQVHPNFIGGKVALARALFDRKEYAEVVEQMKTVVQDAPDNLAAQRLLADSCLLLGQVAEALDAYKMYLYFVPHDQETAQLIQELEAQAYEKGTLVLRTDPVVKEADFDVAPVQEALTDSPDAKKARWVRQVELLQGMLQRVERYRARVSTG